MKFKIILSNFIISFIIVIILISNVQVQAFNDSIPSLMLVEAETGEILYERNPDRQRSPASITKIMTLLLAMEAVEAGEICLEDRVTVSKYASSMGGSQIFLGAGDIISVENLFKAVIIASANDASVALAEAVAGNCDEFIDAMNKRAEELGMFSTNFTTVNGLPQKDQYTTASDIVKMSRELIEYPEVMEWGQIWMETIKLPEREAMLVNTNRLIQSYPDLDGLKTGYTRNAGFNLVATAKRADMRLISVVLGAENERQRREVTEELLDYGYENYKLEKILNEGELFQDLELENSSPRKITAKISEPLLALTERNSEEEINYRINLQSSYDFPIEAGEKIGEVNSFVGDKVIHSVDLLAEQRVEKANIFRRFWYGILDLIS